MRQVGMSHGVRTNNMSLPRQFADLIKVHHERSRVDRHSSIEFILKADDILLLSCTGQLATFVASKQVSRFTLDTAGQRPNLTRRVHPSTLLRGAKERT